MNFAKIAVAATALSFISFAQAAPEKTTGFYAEVDFSNLGASTNTGNDVAMFTTNFTAGLNINPRMSVEGFFMVGLNDDEVGGVTYSLGSVAGGNIKMNFPLSPKYMFTAKAGVHKMSVERDGASTSNTGAQGSVGIDYFLYQDTYIGGTFSKFANDNFDSMGTFGLRLGTRF